MSRMLVLSDPGDIRFIWCLKYLFFFSLINYDDRLFYRVIFHRIVILYILNVSKFYRYFNKFTKRQVKYDEICMLESKIHHTFHIN